MVVAPAAHPAWCRMTRYLPLDIASAPPQHAPAGMSVDYVDRAGVTGVQPACPDDRSGFPVEE
jgi:hypothetical protein